MSNSQSVNVKASMGDHYTKPWLNIDEQLGLLQQRGLSISNEVKAREYLQRIG